MINIITKDDSPLLMKKWLDKDILFDVEVKDVNKWLENYLEDINESLVDKNGNINKLWAKLLQKMGFDFNLLRNVEEPFIDRNVENLEFIESLGYNLDSDVINIIANARDKATVDFVIKKYGMYYVDPHISTLGEPMSLLDMAEDYLRSLLVPELIIPK